MSWEGKKMVKDLPGNKGRIDNGMMRPFLPIFLLCAACGDNLLVDPEVEGPPQDEPGLEDPGAHFVPDICTARSWPSVKFQDRNVDLTVVPTPDGAAVFTVAQDGGPLRGFAVDGRGELVTKEDGNIIRDDMTFHAVSAAYIDERIVTAAVSDEGSIAIDLVRPDLGAYANLDLARGNIVADMPMAVVRETRLATVGDDKGITGIRFDGSWKTMDTSIVGSTVPVSMSATRYREDTLVAWSTEKTCSVSRIAAERTSTRAFPCENGRVAMSNADRAGFMVYENGDSVMIATLKVGGESEIANTRQLVDFGKAPKIIYDGSRFWVTYLNARNDVVVGYLDTAGNLVSMALEGTQPLGEGYELALVNGGLWLFTVDGAGAGAQRLCLKPIY